MNFRRVLLVSAFILMIVLGFFIDQSHEFTRSAYLTYGFVSMVSFMFLIWLEKPIKKKGGRKA